jgi:hypothetical protein
VEAQDESGSARVQASAGTEVSLTLSPSVLRGVVLDSNGHSVTDFTVRLSPASGGPLRSYPVLNPTGDFRISAPGGSYDVSATAVGYGETGTRKRVELSAGEAFVKLELQGAKDLDGRVIDAQSRAGIPGAEVIVWRSPMSAGRWATVATDGAGEFHLAAAPKHGLLQVRKEGFAPAWAPWERLLEAKGPLEVPLSKGSDDTPGSKPYEGVGLQLDFRGGIHVGTVFEGGPAEAAGVIAGDGLVAVDGQPLSGLAPADVVQRIMGPSGTVVQLSLQRGDRLFEVLVRRRTIQL